MFTVIKKPLTPNIIWDVKKNIPLCKFENGKLETNDVELVEILKAMGYEVTGEVDTSKVDDADVNDQTDDNQETPDTSGEKTQSKRRNRKI